MLNINCLHRSLLVIGLFSVSALQVTPALAEPINPDQLTKYVDALPRPAVLKPVRTDDKGLLHYEVEARQTKQRLHRDLPETTVWGYNGSYPGPTIEARTNQTIFVKWTNNLPSKHLLPVDPTIRNIGKSNMPEVRIVSHLHGGHTPDHSDGHPNAWFTQNFKEVGPNFKREEYVYPNDQMATTLWYHDHAQAITRLNVYAGLAGFYLLRDKHEETLHLPSGKHEIPLAIQDRSFNADGSLFYPDEEIGGVKPSIVPEFFGNMAVVNGKVFPYLEVDPSLYRLRILDGSNSRFYNLKLYRYNEATKTIDFGSPGPAIQQIGSDGGFLSQPVTLDRLLIGPGERADTLVDFSSLSGQTFVLHNNAKTPFKSLDQTTDEVPLPEIMLIRVKACADTSCGSDSSTPSRLGHIHRMNESSAERTRDLTLNESTDEFGRLLLLLNNTPFSAPSTENPRLNSTERWRLINLTEDTHPIHLHLVQFQVLDRRPFDVATYEATRQIVFTAPPVPPAQNEQGWKDTIQANPGMITRIIARFDRPGDYVWHCHILEHEDHDMMRPLTVMRRRGGD